MVYFRSIQEWQSTKQTIIQKKTIERSGWQIYGTDICLLYRKLNSETQTPSYLEIKSNSKKIGALWPRIQNCRLWTSSPIFVNHEKVSNPRKQPRSAISSNHPILVKLLTFLNYTIPIFVSTMEHHIASWSAYI